MDPDIPVSSVEEDDLPAAAPSLASPSIRAKPYDRTHSHPSLMNSAAKVPLPASSPMRSPYQTPAAIKIKALSPRPPSRSPSVTSSYRAETQNTPPLRRSTSSASTVRGNTPQFRRASSNLNPLSAINGKMSTPERPPVTANSVAKDYFEKELEAHTTVQAPVVVIVHDSCYGHRFSRPRASKNALATIVERPERIHATVLGASAAYVRLGSRHAEGEFAPKPKHDPSAVCNVPFQIRKTSRIIPLTHPSVAFVHGAKWMEELQVMCDTAEGKLALNGKELVRPIGYGKDENGQPLPKLHEGDLYLCAESLAALQGCLGGVCDAVDTVFSSPLTKRAFVCIRPPGHHCSANYPSGFCWLNNVHVGTAYAAMNHGLTHAAIIDFDLHHGDGSQNIAWDQNRKAHGSAKNAAQHKKTPIGYYSLHDINSYPCESGDEEKVQKASLCIENAHGQSIWNVHLEAWETHDEFWKLYETKYKVLLEKTRLFLRHHTARIRASGTQQPKAAVFISAGFDASEWEGAGMQRHSVNVPTDFYARFTADIARLAQEDDLGVDGRVISVLEGGYSDRALASGVLSHVCGLANDTIAADSQDAAADAPSKYQTINNWVEQVNVNSSTSSYSSDWWALRNLEELEAAVAGRRPSGPKEYQDKTGDYASPTQASTLRMTNNARERQSLTALQARQSLEAKHEPPPPDVDWAIAAYELSRVIIPSDRQTVSCTHEQLNAEATKVRRDRQSAVGRVAPQEESMQLRVRKTKAQPAALPAPRAISRNSSRRTTIAAVSDLSDAKKQPEMPYGRMRRRSSDASSILSSLQGMKLPDERRGEKAPLVKQSTSQTSSRAPSIVPEQPPKPVAVKKIRAPAVPRIPTKPKTSPRKAKAVIPPVPALPTATQGRPTNGVKREFSTSSQDGSKLAPNSDEMENLANGMKKISIKLKVPTAEESTAKLQEKVLEDKTKKPRVPRKPAVPRPTKATQKDPPATTAPGAENLTSVQAKPLSIDLEQPPEAFAPAPLLLSSNMNGASMSDPFIPGAKIEAIHEEQETDLRPYGNDFTSWQVPTVPKPLMGLSVYDTRPPPIFNAPTSIPQHSVPSTSSVYDMRPPPPPFNVAASLVQPQALSIQSEYDTRPPPPSFTIPSQPPPNNAFAPGSFPGFQPTQSPNLEIASSETALSETSNPFRATTPIRRTKQDLPVFTSSSPIPFGSSVMNNKEASTDTTNKEGSAKQYFDI